MTMPRPASSSTGSSTPLDETITLLTLRGDAYASHGVYRRGDALASPILDGFSISVDEVFDVR